MDPNFLLALGATLVTAAAYVTSTAVLVNVTRKDLKAFKDDVNRRFEAMDNKFEQKFEAMDKKFEQKFEAMDARFEQKFAAFEVRLGTLESSVAVIRAICEERNRI